MKRGCLSAVIRSPCSSVVDPKSFALALREKQSWAHNCCFAFAHPSKWWFIVSWLSPFCMFILYLTESNFMPYYTLMMSALCAWKVYPFTLNYPLYSFKTMDYCSNNDIKCKLKNVIHNTNISITWIFIITVALTIHRSATLVKHCCCLQLLWFECRFH